MMQVLLFMIKVIEWILLGIFGLILAVFLMVLFSAVRYQIDGSKRENISGKIHITWLLWILSITVCYQEKLQLTVKLFGRTVWKNKQEESGENPENLEDIPDFDSGLDWTPQPKPPDSILPVPKPEIQEENNENNENAEKAEKKLSAAEKIKTKIDAVIQKLRCSFQEICGKLKQIQDKISWAEEKWNAILTYLENPRNKKSARLIIRQIKKLFLYVLPKKGEISVIFGRDDPYLMGKVLTYASFCYPFAHKIVTLHPVFGENILEGEVHIRGHIRIGIILGIILRIFFDRNILRQLWHFIRPEKKRKRNKKKK